MNCRALLVTGVLLAIGAAAGPAAQVPPSQPANQSFEVASVKPNKSGDGSISFGMQPGGRFTATNVPLRELIAGLSISAPTDRLKEEWLIDLIDTANQISAALGCTTPKRIKNYE